MIGGRIAFDAFAGRAAELAFLRERLNETGAGSGAAVLIVGDAGLGKSRLVNEFHKSTGGGARVIVGSCLDYARNALEPFLQILTAVDAAASPSIYAGAQDELLQPGDRRARLFDAIVERLRTAARADPALAIVIEDLHWADDTTLQMLEHLLLELPALPLCLIATCRSDALRDEPRIASALSSFVRRGARAIYMDPLTRGEARYLLRGALRGQKTLSLPELERIEDLAAGNPLYLEELLREALDERAEPCAGRREHVPGSLKAAVAVRVKRLSAGARKIVTTAALLGDDFDVRLLALLCSKSEATVVDALQECADENVLVESASPDRYRFRHALIREALYSALTPATAKALHARAAEALERHFGAAGRLTELAYHWSVAGNGPMALRYNEEAGNAAMLACTYRDAARFYRTALKFSPPAPARDAELNGKLAYALYCDGSLDESKAYFRRAIAAHIETNATEFAVRLVDLLYTTYWYDGDTQGGLEFAAEVLAIADRDVDGGVRSALLIRTAGFLNVLDMKDEVEKLLRRIGKPAGALGDHPRITLHVLRAITFCRTGQFSNGVREFEAALTLAQTSQSHLQTSKVAGNLASCYRLMGRFADAERMARYAMDHADLNHLSAVHRCARAVEYADILFERGRLPEAAEIVERVVADAVDFSGLRLRIAFVGIPIALETMRDDLLSRCGDDSIVEVAFATGDLALVASAAHAFVRLYRSRGRFDEAASLLQRTMRAFNRPEAFGIDLLMTALKYGAGDDVARARRLVVEICTQRPALVRRAYTAYAEAITAQREARRDARKRQAAVAAEAFGKLGMLFYRAEVLEMGGSQRAALELYRSMGATAQTHRLERIFADRGDRGGRLTRRQRQIGKLICSGASNRDVARQLRISEKTLSNHLTGMYRRLEAGSRDALIASLGDQFEATS